MHVVRVKKTGYVDKQGRERDYSSAYLRRTYREAGTVKNETVANISALPDHVIDLIDAGLKGQQLVPAAGAVTITGSLPHGHVAAAYAICSCGDCFDAKITVLFCRRQISVDRHHRRGKSDNSNRAFHCLSVAAFVPWNLSIPLRCVHTFSLDGHALAALCLPCFS